MDVFAEFETIAAAFADRKIPYAVIGGVALAFHAQPRFTKDVDLLVAAAHFSGATETLKSCGYFPSAGPWTFPKARLTLHRFLKPAENDEFFVDVLVAEAPELEAIVGRAKVVVSPGHPPIPVAVRNDLIALKKLRASPQDQADIARLQDE